MKLAAQYIKIAEGKVNEDLPIKLQTAMERLEKKPTQAQAEIASALLNELIQTLAGSTAGKKLLKEFANVAYEMVVRGEAPEADAPQADAKSDEQAEAGFDLGIMPVQKWKELLQDMGIKSEPVRDEKALAYKWEGPSITLFTGANPLKDGILFNTAQGTRGAGYTSYIGITGNATDVEHVFNFIKQHGDHKDENPTEREYI